MEIRTKKTECALLLLASVFLFASVTIFSASRCASFAFGHVVDIDSCSNREVTKFRRSAFRCDDLRER